MLSSKDLKDIINMGIELTTEKDKNKLLEMILVKAMKISNCDAGTLYLYQDNSLNFKIMKTISMNVNQGVNGEKINLPPVPLKKENVCAYAAIYQELVNIPNVYNSERFDFSGPRNYDSMTGYHTESMLVIPMMNMDSELVGVLQLINALDKNGNVITFNEDSEFMLTSLGSQAGVAVSNMMYTEEIRQQMHSFVAAFATAVDEITPYNGCHTRNVTIYAHVLAKYINKKNSEGECDEYFDENRMEQLELAASLHDIGKMVVPLDIMNKKSRLDKDIDKLEQRYKLLKVYYELDMIKGKITKEEFENIIKQMDDNLEFIHQTDTYEYITEDVIKRVDEIAKVVYVTDSGEIIPWLTEREQECLHVQSGTLTPDERRQMREHVVVTKRILDRVHFNSHYSNVARFAASHHEFLDGSGYPNHLSGNQLELETRILAVVDVYDALTCSDRPYKEPFSKETAFGILKKMAQEGKLEERLVLWLEQAVKEQTLL